MITTFTFPFMNQTYFEVRRFASIAIAGVAFAYSAPSWAAERGWTWLERPWNIRYFLQVESKCAFQISHERAKRNNEKYLKKGNVAPFMEWESIFASTSATNMLVESDGCKDGLAVVAISFDSNGHALTPNSSGKKLQGKVSMINTVMLVAKDEPNRLPYFLADWFWGIPGDGAVFSPGVCTLDDHERYAKGFDADNNYRIGNFGCREWTYQLRDSGSPYIDITSYEKQGEFIKPTIGWGRFDIAPKPVIGQDGKNWACLYECPSGSSPGIIPNIESWAAKYGFPVPQRPERTPMFRDEDYPEEPDD